ncbi:EAL domain-containing protein [Aeromonas veronii]
MSVNNPCHCMDINSLKSMRYRDIYSSLTSYEIKFEKIVSWHNDILGYEILLDFDHARKNGEGLLAEYKKGMLDSSATEYTLSQLVRVGGMGFNPKRFFVNIERNHLCNPLLLRKAALVSKELFLNDIELVLEITERNPCGKCIKMLNGLRFLKDSGVSLAVDDYDIYNGDFRTPEVLAGVYDYIKIEMPMNEHERRCFNAFSLQFAQERQKIILERVEYLDDVKALVRPFGLQGYFNRQ